MGLVNSQLSPAMQAEITAIVRDALQDGELQKSIITGKAATPSTLIADFTLATGIASATEQILKTYLLPPGTLSDPAYWKLMALWAKSGTTDAVTMRVRLGTTGTVADTQLWSSSLGAANRTQPTCTIMFAATPTQLRLISPAFTSGMETGSGSTNVYPVNLTVPDTNALPLFLTLTCQPAGATDTPQIAHVILETR